MRRLSARQAEQEQRDELLSAYLDDQLSAGERASLEAQLATDPALQAELEALRHTVALVCDLPSVPIPRNFILPQTMTARPWPVPSARPRRALRTGPQGKAWAAPLLTAATAVASLFFIVVLAGDLLLSGGGDHLAYAPVAERQAEAPQLSLESPANGQEVEAEEVVSDATLVPVEVPPPAAEAPIEAPSDAAGGGGEISPADATPTAALLSVPTEAPPEAVSEATAGEESYGTVAPEAMDATVSAAGVGRGDGGGPPTPPVVEEPPAPAPPPGPTEEEEFAAVPTTPGIAVAEAEADEGGPELTPSEVGEVAPPMVGEGEPEAVEGEQGTPEGGGADLALARAIPWRILEITLGLTALGLALAAILAWRTRRR
jgi:anti-sigma factor RsiW